MSAVATTHVAPDHGSWTREFWLNHCEGYRVESVDGFVGFVEEVINPFGESEPTTLRICLGFEGREHLEVPVGMVREIHPDAERLVL